MTDYFDKKYQDNCKDTLLDRLKEASNDDLVLVDEILLSELWPASDDEMSENPNIKYSFTGILRWLLENEIEGWKPVVVERSDTEHHNLSTGEKYYRPMAFRRY